MKRVVIKADGSIVPADGAIAAGPIADMTKGNPNWANVSPDLLIYVCVACLHPFQAVRGQETTHECPG